MRVTKLIKEYVSKAVAEKMPLPEKPKAECLEQYDMLKKALTDYCQDAIKTFVRNNFNEIYLGSEKNSLEKAIADVEERVWGNYPALYSRGINEWHKEYDRVVQQRKEKVDEILVSLELGANKADLDNMLASI